MNIYLVIEDGDTFCIRAHTMKKALDICERSYLEDRKEDEKENYDEKGEVIWYHENVLTSCNLVGELRN